MSLVLEDLHKLKSGWRASVEVCMLPVAVARIMGCAVPAVYLSSDSYEHIRDEHPDVTDVHLLMVPIAIQRGLILREHKRPECLTVCYQAEAAQRFIVALKMASTKADFWVTSVHRSKARQTKSLLKRATILRPHK